MNRFILISLLFFVCLNGCREPYMPDIEEYENLLVIDGLITDRPGMALVRLTRSFAFDQRYPMPEEGAVVLILDENETPHICVEEEPGKYRPDPDFRGLEGQSYKLSVSTVSGETYESDWVRLQSSPPIDSISYVLEEREGSEQDDLSYGMQIHVSTHDPSNHTRYYRWEWVETWEYLTPIKAPLYIDEERCWRTAGTGIISLGTTEHLREDILLEHPVFFVSNETNRLKIRYSVEVLQYALGQEAYSYWKNLQDINQNTGSLFDPTPAMVIGNMSSTDGDGKVVLGLFQASGVSSKRVFIDRDELPYNVDIPSGFEGCVFYQTADTTEINYYFDNNFPFAGTYTEMGMEFFIFSNAESCFRCTVSGSNEMPEYWIE